MASGRPAVDGEGNVAVAARPDVAELGAVDVAAGQEGPRPLRIHSQHLPEVRRLDQHGDDRGLGRHVDVLPLAGQLAVVVGDQGAHGGVGRGPAVRLGMADAHRRPVLVAGQPEGAAGGHQLQVRGRGRRVRARLAEGRDGGHHQARIGGAEVLPLRSNVPAIASARTASARRRDIAAATFFSQVFQN